MTVHESEMLRTLANHAYQQPVWAWDAANGWTKTATRAINGHTVTAKVTKIERTVWLVDGVAYPAFEALHAVTEAAT